MKISICNYRTMLYIEAYPIIIQIIITKQHNDTNENTNSADEKSLFWIIIQILSHN